LSDAISICNFHLPALLSDRGASVELISGVVAIGSAGSLFGRLFTGMALDRFPVRHVAAVFFAGQVVGFVLLMQGLDWTLPAGFLLGAVQGAEIDIMGFVVARRFGSRAYSRIFGTCFAVTLIGAMLGPILMAAIFDHTGSYALGLMILSVLPVVALGLLWRAASSSSAVAMPVASASGLKGQ
jgi:cyanate permease